MAKRSGDLVEDLLKDAETRAVAKLTLERVATWLEDVGTQDTTGKAESAKSNLQGIWSAARVIRTMLALVKP